MSDSDNSAPAETASMGVNEGAEAIAAILNPPPPADKEPEGSLEAEHVDTQEAAETDGEADVSDEDTVDQDEEQPEQEAVEEPKYRLADGTEATLAEIEEWRKGTLRQSDYTRKTQELAATRKELETHQAEITQKAQTFQQNVDFAIQVAQANLPAEPDQELLYSDPIAYIQEKAQYDARLGQLQHLMGAKQEHEQALAAQRAQAFKEWTESESKNLVERLPELKDPAKLTQFNAELAKGIERYGFEAKDLGQVYDHRLILLAKDAMAYQKLMAKKPVATQKAADAPPVQQPGRRAGPGEAQARAHQERMAKLRSTGSLRDGADALLDLIK